MRAVDVSGAPCVRDASHQDVRVVDVVVVLDEVGDRVVARRRHRAVEVDGCEGGALAASDPEVDVLHAVCAFIRAAFKLSRWMCS